MKARAPLSAINITPLVDVLLILVATLLLIAPQLVKRLPVDLPRVNLEGEVRLQQSLLVVIDAEGRYSVDGQPMSTEDLRARIQPGLTTVEIAASGAIAYREVLGLVERLSTAQPAEIVLVTR